MDSQETRSLLIAVILSVAIFWAWGYFFDNKRLPNQPATVATQQASVNGKPAPQALASTTAPVPTQILKREEALQTTTRLKIEAPSVKGSINLQGCRFDDMVLTQFADSTKKNSPAVTLLNPDQTAHPYQAEFGWVSADSSVKLPDQTTVWKVKGGQATLTEQTPVTLTWDNGQGLTFERHITVDANFVFQIQDKVLNTSGKPVTLSPYGLVVRDNVPKVENTWILHEGPIGYLDSKLIELKYDDLKDKPLQSFDSIGGWQGITDKYWLTALIPDQTAAIKVNYREMAIGATNKRYQVDYTGPAQQLTPGGSIQFTSHLFTGAKVLSILDQYEEKLGIKHFDLAVDFGKFYFMTKPIFLMLTKTKDWLGNIGLGILLLTVILKVLFFPLANKSYRSMAHMKNLQPKIQALRDRFGDDKMRLNQEMMDLYKREKINPAAGCLPMLLQIPVFFALYKVLYVTIEMRHAPFYGWIQDLAAPDPTSLFNLFGLIPWAPPSFLLIGAWPLIMGLTMFIQQKMNPSSGDPIQEKVFLLMPIMFTFMLAQFPAGLVIYWAWSNVLTIIQQWVLMKFDVKRV